MKGSDFELPSFLQIEKEVTGDPAYSMYNLSKKEASDTPEKPLQDIKLDDALVTNGRGKSHRRLIHHVDRASMFDMVQKNGRFRRISENDPGRGASPECYPTKSRSGSLVSDRDLQVIRLVERSPEKNRKKKETKESSGDDSCGHDDMLKCRQDRFLAAQRSMPALCRVAL